MTHPPFYLTPEQTIEEYDDLSYAITSGKDVNQEARAHQKLRKQIISALKLQEVIEEDLKCCHWGDGEKWNFCLNHMKQRLEESNKK